METLAIHTEDAVEKESSAANSSDEENISSEDEFRGFESIPRVRVERFDITKYFDDIKLNHGPSKDPRKELVQSCTVQLVRDDLSKLRDLYKRNLLQNKDNLNGKDWKLKCKICEKAYVSERNLQNHQVNKHLVVAKPHLKPPKRVSFSEHVIVHEVKEYHRCRKCPKIFETYTALKVHIKRKHRKRKCYICNYCSQKFVDRMFFKVHMKLHCDVCGQLMANKCKLTEHRRNVCNVVKKYTCKTCDEQYFRFMDLKDHSYDHLGTYFICDICKDQFQTKCEVAHHITSLHSKHRPKTLYSELTIGTDRLYACSFCLESSADKDVIENHISNLPDLSQRDRTDYKDFSFCDQCLKKFATETDMLQHKWTHFMKSRVKPQDRPMPKSKKTKEPQSINVNERIPEYMQPKLVLEKIKIGGKAVSEPLKFVKAQNVDLVSGEIKKAVVDPVSKKTIISKHQCPRCHKYFSSNYCLNRHKATVHDKFSDLQCPVCGETFVWPALLYSHKCLRDNLQEMPFEASEDAGVHFDHTLSANCLDDLTEEDSYMNSMDFEIPAPIVELTEYDNFNVIVSDSERSNGKVYCSAMPDYKIVIREVPIEF